MRIAENSPARHPVQHSRAGFSSLRHALGLAMAVFCSLPVRADPLPCQPEGAQPFQASRIAEDGTLTLADGRDLIIAHILHDDVAPLDGAAGSMAPLPGWQTRLAAWLAGQTVSWKPAGEPDRWGRIPANLFLREPDGNLPPFWLQAGLVHHGHAALWPQRQPAGCLETLRAAEKQAIAHQKGRWDAVMQTRTLAAISRAEAAQIGRRFAMVLQVKDVRPWHEGTFVNFMPSFHGAPSVFLTSRQMEALRNAQRDPYSWQGKRLLLRAVVNEPGLRKLRIESIDQVLPID